MQGDIHLHILVAMIPHESVLLQEFLSFFEARKIKTFVDGTIGAGGHALALLEGHPEIEHLIGFDRDERALEIAGRRLHKFAHKITLHHSNFRKMKSFLKHPVDGIFLDLGVSSMQLDVGERGFSFMKEGPLDMRMDETLKVDAAKVVNTFSEKEIADIFYTFGEEPRSRRAAKAIVEARKKKKIKTTLDLAEILKPVLTWSGRRRKNIHPLTLVFQALRIYVNEELKSIEEVIPQAIDSLAPGGRLGIISFQSLEDRLVKEIFRAHASEKKILLLTKKPLVPKDEEVELNPRSRSAKMRFLERIK